MNGLILLLVIYVIMFGGAGLAYLHCLKMRKNRPALTPYSKPEYHEYWRRRRFFYDLQKRILHRGIYRDRMTIDIFLHYGPMTSEDATKGIKREYYTRKDEWVRAPAHQLRSMGYKPIEGAYDSIIFWGVPIFCKIHNGSKADISGVDPATGEYYYSQDTAATLHDVMTSNATLDFIKGLGKTSLPAMDLQKIGMIAIIGVSMVLGLYMLGVI